ncbi:HWE histidine kinase domain-containing protein [Aureimonas mangrovi]|uniref:HWE histidine kinase domain-containing protein n=1 Tax=Aureimonas mangrovi TaxID=2758041 RepID=UPI00163DC70B|nr:HWE histidine kinase domain-containing protein [Aureimonas mangrovi]
MDRLSFRQLFRALPGPHMMLDRDLRFAAVNQAYEITVGRTEAQLLGWRVEEAFPNTDESGRRLVASLDRVLETGEPDVLAYIPYPIAMEENGETRMVERFWTAVHTPLFSDKGELLYILQNTVDVTELVKLRENTSVPFRILPGELDLVQRAREADEVARQSRDNSTDFRRLFENAPGMIAVLHGPNHLFTYANEAFVRFVGHDVVTRSVRDALQEMAGQGLLRILEETFRTGRAFTEEAKRIVLNRASGICEAYLDISFHPISDRAGRITGVFVQAYDRTDSVLHEQRQRLLLDELNHRVKNTLSTVQSIARQSLRGGHSPAVAQATFDSRIRALSKAHDVLSDRHWESAELNAILAQELAVYGARRVTTHGTLTRLRPKAAIALAMVLHELASNAAKYGALSVMEGELNVSWRHAHVQGRAALQLEWREHGFATDTLELAEGFGIRMLHRIINGELDGRLDLAIQPGELIWRIEVPLSEVEAVASADAH